MNSSEQRRSARKHVSNPIEVVDSLTGESLGRVGNLSHDGMMLIGSRRLNDNALYQVRFHLPGSGGKPHPLEVGVHEQWSEPAAVPGQHWAGLRIIALSDADTQVLDAWLQNPDF